MGETCGSQATFITVCGRFVTLRLVWTTNRAHVTCPDCLRAFLAQAENQIRDLKDGFSASENRRRVSESDLEAKSKNVKRLADELASSLNRLDRAERLNLVLARSLRGANEETGRLLGILGI
jgi:hypothetical protein